MSHLSFLLGGAERCGTPIFIYQETKELPIRDNDFLRPLAAEAGVRETGSPFLPSRGPGAAVPNPNIVAPEFVPTGHFETAGGVLPVNRGCGLETGAKPCRSCSGT